MLRVLIQDINEETGEVVKEIEDGMYEGFAFMGKCDDGERIAEIISHCGLMDIASWIAQGKHMYKASKLANVMHDFVEGSMAEDHEDSLIDRLMGGLQ